MSTPRQLKRPQTILNIPNKKKSKPIVGRDKDQENTSQQHKMQTQPQDQDKDLEITSTIPLNLAMQRVENKIDYIARKSSLLEIKLNDILQRLDEGGLPNTEEEVLTDFGFPLNTIEDIQKCDDQLKPEGCEKQRKDFIKIISMIGGKTTTNIINGLMGRIFSNELSAKCSWHGKKGNFAFSSTNIFKLIKDFLTNPKTGKCTEAELKIIGSNFFRFGH